MFNCCLTWSCNLRSWTVARREQPSRCKEERFHLRSDASEACATWRCCSGCSTVPQQSGRAITQSDCEGIWQTETLNTPKLTMLTLWTDYIGKHCNVQASPHQASWPKNKVGKKDNDDFWILSNHRNGDKEISNTHNRKQSADLQRRQSVSGLVMNH